MLNVRPVNKEDFEKVYPLFAHIPTPTPITKGVWENLFERQWDCQIEPLGYVLMEENTIVGYIGLICVQREIHGQQHDIVGLTSWAVEKKYSGHSIKMLFPFIRDQKKTFLCFTPSKSVDVIFRRFGLQELHAALQLIPFWALSLGKNDYQIHFDVDQQQSLLTQKDRQIYSDFRTSSSEHFMIKNDKAYCYVVTKRTLKKKWPFLQIHYVSDKALFIKAIEKFVWTICCRTKTLGLILFDSYLDHKKMGSAVTIKMQAKPLFRSTTLKAEDIDSLYSEFFVLNF